MAAKITQTQVAVILEAMQDPHWRLDRGFVVCDIGNEWMIYTDWRFVGRCIEFMETARKELGIHSAWYATGVVEAECPVSGLHVFNEGDGETRFNFVTAAAEIALDVLEIRKLSKRPIEEK